MTYSDPPTQISRFADVSESPISPKADPNWRPTTYEYYDEKLNLIFVSQTPNSDNEAIDKFAWVAGLGSGYNPVYLKAIRPDGTRVTIPWTYDKEENTAYEVNRD